MEATEIYYLSLFLKLQDVGIEVILVNLLDVKKRTKRLTPLVVNGWYCYIAMGSRNRATNPVMPQYSVGDNLFYVYRVYWSKHLLSHRHQASSGLLHFLLFHGALTVCFSIHIGGLYKLIFSTFFYLFLSLINLAQTYC